MQREHAQIGKPAAAPQQGAGSRPVTLLCVDDNVLLGKALGRCINAEPSLKWLGAVSDGNEAIETAQRLRPDVILMDIDMPGFDTFRMVEELAEKLPDTRVVMLSGHVDREYLKRALDAGAWGYLSKAEETDVLIDGVHRAARGEIALGKEIDALQR
ncbi:MAG TPA: response regulator transcription factor, partial [Phycisphaerales bacterium]|nr:response regulator transcription factor [Phycisphaerales bacterium]